MRKKNLREEKEKLCAIWERERERENLSEKRMKKNNWARMKKNWERTKNEKKKKWEKKKKSKKYKEYEITKKNRYQKEKKWEKDLALRDRYHCFERWRSLLWDMKNVALRKIDMWEVWEA
jgi:hypothetical protein